MYSKDWQQRQCPATALISFVFLWYPIVLFVFENTYTPLKKTFILLTLTLASLVY